MENFRDFHAGPDPFGRRWHVQFRYLQTAISIRHSDSVDVRFLLTSGDETVQKTVVIRNPDVRAYDKAHPDRKIGDTWLSRVAMCKLRNSVETGEDIEKDYLVVTPAEMAEFDAAIKAWETDWVKKKRAA